ncbi:hypothetical protein GCK72_011161 [Caenorhabditis remanei]|uniref:Uncharacterized protein n=1 Tax=Caenorhabditis remanei TaxID=31234 RepID=A0A6A5H6S7_CAERE|nr:hypothetical protein GCK72_011161 [Caenorhabditis remanei]KAF1762897.1 hypothetical protein GCK72_011161 [Caenorhabditis remanei]
MFIARQVRLVNLRKKSLYYSTEIFDEMDMWMKTAEARGARGTARANAPGGDAAEAVNLPAAHRMNFKDNKTAMEALLTTMPRFSGKKDEDPYVQWIEKFVRESNSLRLGRQLTIAVFPRMLSASARLKYDGLSNEEKTDFGLATQALAEILRVSSGRDKALNELSKTTKKTTESMVRFAKRIENVTRTSFPGLENEQRTEITINRFIQSLPSRIKVKMLEKDIPEDLEEAIFLAEKMEEIIKEEDEETINLIDRDVIQRYQATWTDVVENLIRSFEVPEDRELAQQEITILKPQNAEFSRMLKTLGEYAYEGMREKKKFVVKMFFKINL